MRTSTVALKLQRDLTDDELRAVARWVALTQLEIERGQRPAKALRGLLAPHLYHDLAHARRPAGAPPVTAGDLGNAAFNRVGRTGGYAVVAIREADGSWDALTMVLRRLRPARWQFIDITRASRYVATPSRHTHRSGAPG